MDVSSYICPRHNMPSPCTCWVVGRTTLSFFDGKLQYARIFTTPDAATQRVLDNEEFAASKIREFEELGLAAPERYSKWKYMVWNGSLPS